MEIPIYHGKIPYVDTRQMIEVDRAMIEDYHIQLIQMMENAGRNLAHLARIQFLDGIPIGKDVVVLAGTGGNGGGGLVSARRLANWGAVVSVYLTKAKGNFTPIPAHQLDILTRMGLKVAPAAEIAHQPTPALIIDGLIGYSLKGNPRGAAADLINWANQQACPILSLDAPSGVDTTSGTVYEPAIQATATMTLALPKKGLLAAGIDKQVGDLYLADISVPPGLYQGLELEYHVDPVFAQADIIRIV